MSTVHAQRIVLNDQSVAPETAHSNDKAESVASTRRAAACTASSDDLQANAGAPPFPLPKGCAVGVPVSASFAARPLPEGKEILSVALNFVQRDDYHALLELARRGYQHALSGKRRCGFSLSLKPEGCAVNDLPHTLKVRGANLLHYAVCIGSFRAAAALILVSPELLTGTCVVSNEHEEVWTATELARLFCVLYDSADSPASTSDISQTSVMFELAVKVLELSETETSKLPFVALPTVEERIAAAGCDADAALAAFFEAAQIKF
jgi:hypothetical protein